MGLWESAADAHIVITADGFVLDWNPAAERLFGYARAQALGRELADLIIPEEFRQAHREALGRVRQTNQPTVLGRSLELVGQSARGLTFPVELTIRRIGDAKPALFVGVVRIRE